MANRSASAPLKKKRRIVLVDDHPLMRRGQADLINREDDMEVCGEAGTAADALELIEKAQPDLVVMDMGLPDKEGLELIKDIRALHPNLPVLAMSMQHESLYAPRVLRAGGRGYLMKNEESTDELVPAIRTILSGSVALSARMSAKMLESMVGPASQPSGGPEARLTDRELEVLRLFGEGWSVREIATHLNLSSKTVDVHRSNIKHKLEIPTTPEFQRFAIQWAAAQQKSED